MNIFAGLAERLIRRSGPDATDRLIRSLLKDYEHLSSRRLRSLGILPAAIFDIGAYYGNSSRTARKLFPAAKIIMVEAQPALAAALQKAGADLGTTSVHNCVLAAVASRRSTSSRSGPAPRSSPGAAMLLVM